MKYHLLLPLFESPFRMRTYNYGRMMEARNLRPKDIAAMTGLTYQRVSVLLAAYSPPEQYWPMLAWALNLSRVDFAREMLACMRHPFVPLAEALRLEAESQTVAKTA